MDHSGQRAPDLFSLQAPLLGKEARRKDQKVASGRGWRTLGHTGSDAPHGWRFLPSAKGIGICKNRFKVNNSIEMVMGATGMLEWQLEK